MVMHHFEFFSMQKVSRGEEATATASNHVAASPREMSKLKLRHYQTLWKFSSW
jgi:hypothetical protein